MAFQSSASKEGFSYFGDFGNARRYNNLTDLPNQIKKILKLNVVQKAAFGGVGNLGMAILAFLVSRYMVLILPLR